MNKYEASTGGGEIQDEEGPKSQDKKILSIFLPLGVTTSDHMALISRVMGQK